MTSTPQAADTVGTWARRQAEHYRGEVDRPLGSYLGMLGIYTGCAGSLTALGWLFALRAPFTRFGGSSAAGELAEDVRGHGIRHSVGELVACPMCLAQWVATALGAGHVFAPRQTRLVMATLSAVAGADFLQYLYAQLQQQVER